jgi:hypothetical protein
MARRRWWCNPLSMRMDRDAVAWGLPSSAMAATATMACARASRDRKQRERTEWSGARWRGRSGAALLRWQGVGRVARCRTRGSMVGRDLAHGCHAPARVARSCISSSTWRASVRARWTLIWAGSRPNWILGPKWSLLYSLCSTIFVKTLRPLGQQVRR